MGNQLPDDRNHKVLRRALILSNLGIVLFFVSWISVAALGAFNSSSSDGENPTRTWIFYAQLFIPAFISVVSVWLASEARRASRALGDEIDPRDKSLRTNVAVFSIIVIIYFLVFSFFQGLGYFVTGFFAGTAQWEAYVLLVMDAGVIVLGILRGLIAPKGSSDE